MLSKCNVIKINKNKTKTGFFHQLFFCENNTEYNIMYCIACNPK